MFDFSSLEPMCGEDSYSFVGISDGKLRLPKGCKAWVNRINGAPDAETKFLVVREAFLRLFQVLRTFRSAGHTTLKNDRDSAQKGRDGGRELLGTHSDEGEVIYYHHLDLLDCILDVHNDLSILSLAQRVGRSERLNYEKMHKHLDRANFMDDDSFIVDEMLLPRNELAFEPVEIVQMYSFVLFEIRKLLGEEHAVTSDMRVLAEQFLERHLAAGDGLFSFDTWVRTRTVLRERLEIIDANTTYKDDVYHDLYDALERFLWGESRPDANGLQWGISAFAPVWESMCMAYVCKTQPKQVAVCDASNIPIEALGKLSHLICYEELEKDGEIVSLRATEEFDKVFIVNDVQIFPDCIVYNNIETQKAIWYKEYGVSTLADNGKAGGATSQVDSAFKAIWQGIKSRNGPSQRTRAKDFVELLDRGVTPGNLTAFFLGRAISGAFESVGAPKDSREKTFDEIVRRKYGSPFLLHLLRGMAWEVYFDRNDSARDLDYVKYRKSLYSYQLVMAAIKANHSDSQIQELSDFVNAIDQLAQGTPAPCTVIDFKYLEAAYFKHPGNETSIRSRSIRKQFVYEYLIERASGCDRLVASEFWVPAYDDNIERIDLGYVQFLDGYIPLRRMNMLAITEAYREFG